MFQNYLDGAIILTITHLAEDSENEFVKKIFARINQHTPTQASGHSAQRFERYGISGTDAGCSKQERVFCLAKNSQSKNVQGCTFLTRWLQSALIPFITTPSVGVLNHPHE